MFHHFRCMVLLLMAWEIHAAEIPQLARFVEEQLTITANALGEGTEGSPAAPPGSWKLRQTFSMRVYAQFGFQIPGALSLQATPDIDITWQKKTTPPELR